MRLDRMRNEFANSGIDGFVAYNTDRFGSEYISEADKRIEFITGFTGSWAILVVLREKAALFVDGRYIRQAKKEVTESRIEVLEYPGVRPGEWLIANGSAGDAIGYDAWLCTAATAAGMQAALEARGMTFKPCDNVIDAVWNDRPEPPSNIIENHDMKYAGVNYKDKLEQVRAAIRKEGAEYLLLTALDSIAWLFNLRGTDIPYNPLFYAFAVVGLNDAVIYARSSMDDMDEVRFKPLDDFAKDIKNLKNNKVMVDFSNVAKAVVMELDNPVKAQDPCRILKSVKNDIEQMGAKWAHIREGAVFAKFFSWLEHNDKTVITELDVIARIEKIRHGMENYRGPSFSTICGVDSNAGIVHYVSAEETNRTLDGQIMLVDSGGQYLEGTTDMTRTISLDGNPSAEQVHCYTLVLKGHLALGRAEFPEGVQAGQLDTLARQFLWQEGLDYSHGTGHGVGSYLSVHENPPVISPHSQDSIPLKPGMITSNEPGCYNDRFGVRIENLVKVIRHDGRLGFENLTLIPYDRNLIDVGLLTRTELEQINEYHRMVLEKVKPYLEKDEAVWLKKACRKL